MKKIDKSEHQHYVHFDEEFDASRFHIGLANAAGISLIFYGALFALFHFL